MNNTSLSFSAFSPSSLLHFSLFSLSTRPTSLCLFPSGRDLGFLRPPKSRPTSVPPLPSHPSLPPSFLHRDEEDEDEDEDNEEDEVVAEEYEEVLGASEPEDDYESGTNAAAAFPMWSEEPKWKRVERLRSQVRELGEGIIDVEELASIYDFPIDKFQRMAILAFLRGSSVVVSAPTSSGKTLIAETAAAATIARGRRLFYTTPLKALSNQKYRDFCGTFGDSNVGLVTGDAAVNKDAQIVIMTTEILRNMLYQSVGMVSSGSGLLHVDVIVLDEVHYLSDISRGTVWEEIVIYCPKEVQLICLSATVANPDELAGWIGKIHGTTELVTSTKRPVPLTWHFSTKRSLLPLLDAKGERMNRKLSLEYVQISSSRMKAQEDDGSRKNRSRRGESDQSRLSSISRLSQLSKNDINAIRRSQVPQIRDTLWQLRSRDMLPVIWFIFSRKGCDAAVQYLEHCNLLDECEIDEVALALKRFRIQYPDAVREVAVKGLLQGVAAHHAGCLPLWKSFIEELFQRGLVKVVFATETLAAGINMPARTAVIASLSRRSDSGRLFLTSNELLQMAGRAGRRGIDERGHAVLLQTPYEGAEECCKVLFASLEPLVSQFTASYGMVLNLLAGAKVTRGLKETIDATFQAGRTLKEARKLVEQSFGNYVGSNVMLAAKEEITKIENEIEFLTSEVDEAAIDRKCRQQLSEIAYREIFYLQEELRVAKRLRSELKKGMELERITSLKDILKELENGKLPFLCLQFKDDEAVQQFIPAVYLGTINSFHASNLKDVVGVDHPLSLDTLGAMSDCGKIVGQIDSRLAYHVALGSNNCWYLFTEKWIRSIYKTGLPNVPLVRGDALPREIMKELLANEELQWRKISDSDFGALWSIEGSIETWSWSLNVPVLSSLSEDDEVLSMSQGYQDAVQQYKEQRRKVSQLKKKITNTVGFKEFKKIIDAANFTKEKIKRLKARSDRLSNRIKQIEPSGWKDFLQVSNIIHEARALDINTHIIFPLGETAAAIRGENELWLAMVLRSKVLLDLKPAELAAVCGSLVSEGIKIRTWNNNSYIYEASAKVKSVINFLEGQRSSFMQLQDKHGVNIPCELDSQFPGMVEAWASGLTWRELMMDCAMDEGDLSRLLRRTIDLLAQIPKLPDIDPLLQKNATIASNVMDRAPISELAG